MTAPVDRPALEVADVIRAHGAEFRRRYGPALSPAQAKALRDLARAGFVAVAIDGRYHGARSKAGKGSREYVEAILRTYRTGKEHPLFYDTVWDVMRLIDCGDLKLLPGTTYGKGRGHTPLVTRESFADFLRARLEDSRNIVALPAEGEATQLQNK